MLATGWITWKTFSKICTYLNEAERVFAHYVRRILDSFRTWECVCRSYSRILIIFGNNSKAALNFSTISFQIFSPIRLRLIQSIISVSCFCGQFASSSRRTETSTQKCTLFLPDRRMLEVVVWVFSIFASVLSVYLVVFWLEVFRCEEADKETKKDCCCCFFSSENETWSDFPTICWYLLILPRDAVIAMQKETHSLSHSALGMHKAWFVFGTPRNGRNVKSFGQMHTSIQHTHTNIFFDMEFCTPREAKEKIKRTSNRM